MRLNRFTTLPVLLDMVARGRLVLMNPAFWEDRNDSELLLEYKRRKGANSIFVACFTSGGESIHHWNAFAGGPQGCCIAFDFAKLEPGLRKVAGVLHGPVQYRTLKDLKCESVPLDEMPFTKRWLYGCEKEYRVIWLGKQRTLTFEVPISLDAITRITLSQRMPKHVFNSVRSHLQECFKKREIKINHSTIYENRTWINHFTGTRKKD